eukprot:1156311-Pelagomonas_calceolata.AAC.4
MRQQLGIPSSNHSSSPNCDLCEADDDVQDDNMSYSIAHIPRSGCRPWCLCLAAIVGGYHNVSSPYAAWFLLLSSSLPNLLFGWDSPASRAAKLPG